MPTPRLACRRCSTATPTTSSACGARCRDGQRRWLGGAAAQDRPKRMTTVDALVARFGLPARAAAQLAALLDGLEAPDAPTTVHARAEAIDVHLADSLVALELPAVREA